MPDSALTRPAATPEKKEKKNREREREREKGRREKRYTGKRFEIRKRKEENGGLGSRIGKSIGGGQMATRRIEQRRKCVWNDNDCCNDCSGPLCLLNACRDFNCRLSIAVRLGILLNLH